MEHLKATKEELVEFNTRLAKVRGRMREEEVNNPIYIFYLNKFSDDYITMISHVTLYETCLIW